jgi:DNA-binding transcriptional LysR family regulator
MVSAGLGVAIVPASVAALALSGVVYRPLDDPRAELERWAVWRDDARLAVVRAFIGSLDDEEVALPALADRP